MFWPFVKIIIAKYVAVIVHTDLMHSVGDSETSSLGKDKVSSSLTNLKVFDTTFKMLVQSCATLLADSFTGMISSPNSLNQF